MVINKVRNILRVANEDIPKVLSEYDKSGKGILSNIQFKNALRKLGLGLSGKEID